MTGWRAWLMEPKPSIGGRLVRGCLRCLSVPYAAVIGLRNAAYDWKILRVNQLRIPVICIGNLTVGGTGKTPMVAWLALLLRQKGFRVAIVSRGYGQLASGSNDEALELELKLPDVPHLQDPNRVAAGLLAQDELDMQVVVLDDGFQHRRLARNLDIVIIDATDPAGAHRLLPGGLMRESWSGLRRARIVLLSRTQLADAKTLARIETQVARWSPTAVCARTWHQPKSVRRFGGEAVDLSSLRDRPILAFCGIGNPQAFFRMLRSESLQVVAERTWPDHHGYTAADVEQLRAWTQTHPDCAAVVCTMKDWVKLQIAQLGHLPLLALEIEVGIDPAGRAAIECLVDELMSSQAEPNPV